MLTMPNLPNPNVKVGKDARMTIREVRRWGEPPKFEFEAEKPLGYRRGVRHPGLRPRR